MTVRILRSADRAPSAWKNGGGITHEVAAEPPGAGLDDFGWRVSLAEVASGGPFSAFPQVDRVITLVSGHGMELSVDGVPTELAEPGVPFAFSGDAAVDCRLLDGPVVDFNVMTRRGRFAATVETMAAGRREVTAAGPTTILIVALAGSAAISWGSGEPGSDVLAQYDGALVSVSVSAPSEAETVDIRSSGHVAVVSLTRIA